MQSRNSHGYGESLTVRIVEPRCCDNAGLVRNELQTLLFRIRICNQKIVFLPFSFGYSTFMHKRSFGSMDRNFGLVPVRWVTKWLEPLPSHLPSCLLVFFYMGEIAQ